MKIAKVARARARGKGHKYHKIANYSGANKYAVTPPQKIQRFYNSKEEMPKYNRLIIERLAEHFSGEDLERRLRDLHFCSYETAIEILEKR